MSQKNVYTEGRKRVDVLERSGRPSTLTDVQHVNEIKELVPQIVGSLLETLQIWLEYQDVTIWHASIIGKIVGMSAWHRRGTILKATKSMWENKIKFLILQTNSPYFLPTVENVFFLPCSVYMYMSIN
ncbi:unnamed protein product [Ceratitis capitata]|uniref:(Mediterranean fruit fly) hypothetical protein n=1 Tax=Ceratitis capitata TaxID=7213 RepID=A0A811VM52_CERCA|nr:unnamed protein product [Ceratitis capitata]